MIYFCQQMELLHFVGYVVFLMKSKVLQPARITSGKPYQPLHYFRIPVSVKIPIKQTYQDIIPQMYHHGT